MTFTVAGKFRRISGWLSRALDIGAEAHGRSCSGSSGVNACAGSGLRPLPVFPCALASAKGFATPIAEA